MPAPKLCTSKCFLRFHFSYIWIYSCNSVFLTSCTVLQFLVVGWLIGMQRPKCKQLSNFRHSFWLAKQHAFAGWTVLILFDVDRKAHNYGHRLPRTARGVQTCVANFSHKIFVQRHVCLIISVLFLCFIDRASLYKLFQIKPTRCTLLLSIFISSSLHVSGNCVPIIKRTYCIYATLVFSLCVGGSLFCWLGWDCGGAVGWGTALQVGRSRVRFPIVSMEFLIDIILPVALWPWGWLTL